MRATMATIGLFILGLTSVALGMDISLSTSMMSAQWYYLPSQSNTDGYLLFRRYGIVLNGTVSGSLTFQDIRNIEVLNCSLNPDVLSYVLFVAPREIDVPALVGAPQIDSHNLMIGGYDGGYDFSKVEVRKNEIFSDLTAENKRANKRLIYDDNFIAVLNDSYGVGFRVMPERLPWLDGSRMTFDEILDQQLRYTDPGAVAMTTEELRSACPGL